MLFQAFFNLFQKYLHKKQNYVTLFSEYNKGIAARVKAY